MFELALQELRRDPLFPYLSLVQQREYSVCALAIGYEQGERYRGQDVLSVVENLGIQWVIRHEEGRIAGSTTRAEYDLEPAKITIYLSSLLSFARLLREALLQRDAESLALDIIVAHELFHHLEATQIQPVSEQLPYLVTPVAAGWWSVRRRVRSTREIAAHAFAQTLSGLPILPNALDRPDALTWIPAQLERLRATSLT